MDNRVNELRKQFGKTMKELSAETGIAYPTLSGYKQGIRTPKKSCDKFWLATPPILITIVFFIVSSLYVR